MTTQTPLGIYHEHPDWFRPLFLELDRRGVPYARIDATRHGFDPARQDIEHDVVFNRMSPSAYLRGGTGAIAYTSEYLAHLERCGVRVINGSHAWSTEISKAKQIALLAKLGLPHPQTRVCNDPEQVPRLGDGLRYPVIVKPNVGGSGAGVRRFDSRQGLERAAASARAARAAADDAAPDDATSTEGIAAIDAGADGTLLVQECIPADSGRIVRVEVLNGAYLYAIRIYTPGDSFNLCPADVCQRVDGAELVRAACAVDAPKNGLRVEAYEPPADIIAEVEAIMRAAGIEIGGVEYFIDARDGQRLYYDINALSNFVADGQAVLGFDPFERLADWLEKELRREGATARSKSARPDREGRHSDAQTLVEEVV